MRPVLVLAGPTAGGKSRLALALARRLVGTVINADSMQVYRDLPVLTAQPDAAARAAAPHRLYGHLPLDAPLNAQAWAEAAAAAIRAAWAEERLPILVGGSGLYLRALMLGFAPIPDIPPAIRDEAAALLAAIGPQALHARLAARDPAQGARLAPGDRQRLQRAWEVMAATGRSLHAWHSEPPRSSLPEAAYQAFIILPERASLYRAIDARFLALLAGGAVEEVAAALAAYPEADRARGGFKALGFREIASWLGGAIDRATCVAAAQQATRHYAKRQGVWFRRQLPGAQFITPNGENMEFSESRIASLCQNILNPLLTRRT